jgi:outer membrane protein assembly factor BamB
VLGYDSQSLSPAGAYLVTPGGGGGSVWQSGQAPAADASGQIFIATGNGTFSPDGQNLGDSVVKLAADDAALSVADFFTPWNVDFLNGADAEIGSAGPLLLPDTPFALAAGKEGRFYLLNTSDLGGFGEDGDGILQSFQVTDVPFGHEIAGSPIYWSSPDGPRVYVWATNEALKAFDFDGTFLNPTPIAQSTVTSPPYVWPGGILSLSANGNEAGTAIVWASLAQSDANARTAPGILRAFDAEDVSVELWNSDLDPSDRLGASAKFCPPTIANGRVYMATFSGVIQVYGLRP